MPNRLSAIYVVTGSRHWTGDPSLIRESLARFARTYPGRHHVLYHGQCPDPRDGTGKSVDMLADGYARELGFEVVPFKADWYRGGTRTTVDKSAGPERNLAMCRTAAAREADGAIVEVHGWPAPDSTGTHDCLRAAKECGLHGLVHAMRRSDG